MVVNLIDAHARSTARESVLQREDRSGERQDHDGDRRGVPIGSADGGVSWTAPVNIADATSGAAYETASGFQEFFVDYGEISITNTGKTIGVWGEAFSYTGPGGAWFNRQI